MEELSYEKLREVQKKERSTAMLSEIPGDFYKRVGVMLKAMREQVNSGFMLEKAREYENALKVAKDIYAVREQKILLRALRAAKGTNSVSGLADEEREAFEKVKHALVESDASFDSIIGTDGLPKGEAGSEAAARPKVEEAPNADAPAEQGKKIRVSNPIPQFVGLGGGRHGPFKPGEVVFLPEKESDLLVKRNLASYA
ncbi:Uncharacterised protein [uncultured archaeon]|nr:Uncharacterised protein [uncultured archaeon]